MGIELPGWVEDVAKYTFPVIYYPTKYGYEAGKKLAKGENPVGGLMPNATTDWRPTPPTVNPSLFNNPSANKDVFGNYKPEATLQQHLQAEIYQGGPRAAPTAAATPTNYGLLAPGMSTVGQGTALTHGGAGVAGAALGQSEQTRGVQATNLGMLYKAATGAAPSAAEAQMQRGLGQTLRGNLALAASARGTGASKVAAQRDAQNANTLASMDVLGQTAALRAGEQATARGQLTGALEGVRTADLAGANVGLGIGGLGTNLAGVGANLTGTGATLAGKELDSNTALAISNAESQLKQTGMDDARRAVTLGAILGIDARTQEGQMELQKLVAEAHLRTQAIHAGIEVGNTQAGMALWSAGAQGIAAGATTALV